MSETHFFSEGSYSGINLNTEYTVFKYQSIIRNQPYHRINPSVPKNVVTSVPVLQKNAESPFSFLNLLVLASNHSSLIER